MFINIDGHITRSTLTGIGNSRIYHKGLRVPLQPVPLIHPGLSKEKHTLMFPFRGAAQTAQVP